MKKSIKRKKAVKWTAAVLAAALLLAVGGTAAWAQRYLSDIPTVSRCPQNIILLIGDGMGARHIEAGDLAQEGRLTLSTLPACTTVTTFSKIWPITDSAASASAMATGKKTVNSRISQTLTGRANASITELAQQYGMRTGVISSKPIYDATPAAFSSHASNRRGTEQIIAGQLSSGVDLLMGEGREKYAAHAQEIAASGRQFITDFGELPTQYDQRILFSVEEISPVCEGENPLLNMTRYALKYLSASDRGFFLMVEGGKIDSKSHEKDLPGMLAELEAFDAAVREAVDFARQDGDTLVIVVADHETGGLKVRSNSGGETTLDDFRFTSTLHTARDVRAFFYPESVVPQLPPRIDNTHIYAVMAQAIGGPAA